MLRGERGQLGEVGGVSARPWQPAARPQGGDTRSATTEAKAARIWALYETAPDITLAELRAALAAEGISVAVSTLWRFFARHHHTPKKRPAMRKSRIAPTC